MTTQITTITTPFILNVSVNCYLLKSSAGYTLIDTGPTSKRVAIVNTIHKAGCTPGNLNLIILTHGDFDHCGNAAHLRDEFKTKIAMHPDDAGIVEHGDMTWNRKKPNFVVRTIFSLMLTLKEADRFKPDILLITGDQLSEYGLQAEVISIPGHSKGSLAILTSSGDLFCGDLLANVDQPGLWSIIDDETGAHASVDQLMDLPIKTVYPGHGNPFPMDSLVLLD